MITNLERRKHDALALYQGGATTKEICQKVGVSTNTLYEWIEEEGIEKRKKNPGYILTPFRASGTPMDWDEIEEVRNSLKVGSFIFVKTVKANGEAVTSNSLLSGTRKKAKILDTSHKRFCLVQLPHGVREAVLYTTIATERRKAAKDNGKG